MKRSFFKKRALYLSLAIIFLSLTSFGWVEYQLQRMRGSFVLKVDPDQFQTQSGPLAIRNISVLSPDGATMIPGFSLHDELESLTRVGFSPTEALRAATATPQEWLGEKAGKLLPSYRADLVILDKNPLEQIANTRSINAVILNGELLEKSQLQAMLRAVKAANDQSRSVSIDALNHFTPYVLR